MIVLEYKTSKRGEKSVKLFINKHFAESWVEYNRDSLFWVGYRTTCKVITTAGEVCTEFIESGRI